MMRPSRCLCAGAFGARARVPSSASLQSSCRWTPPAAPSLPFMTPARRLSAQAREELREKYADFFTHAPTPPLTPAAVLSRASFSVAPSPPLVLHGFLGKAAKGGDASLKLFSLTTAEGYEVKLASTSAEMLARIRAIPPYSPVRVAGTVRPKPTFFSLGQPSSPPETCYAGQWSLQLTDIRPLNTFPGDVVISKDVRFPPTLRHLQLRFQRDAAARLRFRSDLRHELAAAARARDYADVETPLLFKATPEGAREFLVPVRNRPGHAYALPQSPQQYKQMLMASGVERYVQFARCFRDEDQRADRQPEFTQMDLERAFADGEQVMRDVEGMVSDAWAAMARRFAVEVADDGAWCPVSRKLFSKAAQPPPPLDRPFPRMAYADCIRLYGTDKPDLRIPAPIVQLPLPDVRELASKISPLPSPLIEACAIHLSPDAGVPPSEVRARVASFMAGLDDTYSANPHGAPVALVIDSSQPLSGLAALGHEGAAALLEHLSPSAEDKGPVRSLADGDVVLIQARDAAAHVDGSTRLGELRPRLWTHLYALVDRPASPQLKFLWVTDFPLFSPAPPAPESEPSSPPPPNPDDSPPPSPALVSTHHPFTAPRSPADMAHLFSATPAVATAEHYDLVLNGVEVGGGSRRIHVAAVQEHVLRHVLRLPDHRVAQFAHLLRALRDGCPPHAGFALGLDRLCAVLSGAASVKDVIAFPKSHKGEDLFVRAPAKVEPDHWALYDLAPVVGKKAVAES